MSDAERTREWGLRAGCDGGGGGKPPGSSVLCCLEGVSRGEQGLKTGLEGNGGQGDAH